MVLTNEQLSDIRKYVAYQTEFITYLNRSLNFGSIKLFNPQTGILETPPDLPRRSNDIIAASFIHGVACNQQSGDDCIDVNGQAIELKLAYVKSDGLTISTQGNLVRASNDTGLIHSLQAKFRVYNGTKSDHHNKDTAFILMSHDHNCFIAGFILSGDEVQRLLMEGSQRGLQRNISLSRFIQFGYEFNSSVPHIGWERYHNALLNYVAGYEGRLSPRDAQMALEEWSSLANLNNLQSL